MGAIKIVDAEVPPDDVIDSCGLGIGYAMQNGKKCVCVVLSIHAETDDGQKKHMAVTHSIAPDDVGAVCDALQMLNDSIGLGQWPDTDVEQEGG